MKQLAGIKIWCNNSQRKIMTNGKSFVSMVFASHLNSFYYSIAVFVCRQSIFIFSISRFCEFDGQRNISLNTFFSSLWRTMHASVKFLIHAFSLLLIANAAIGHEIGQRCLPGNNHKKYASAEENLLACKAYKNNSCCTSDFTRQLVPPPVKSIYNFSWTPCNNTLSARCEAFLVLIECFYRCSPDAIYWENPDFPSAIKKAPICASFCDEWYDACRNDLTCGRNWLTDFNVSADGVNTCKQPCRNFSAYFTNGKDLCEGKWGQTFVYKENDVDCLKMNITSPNQNDEVVKKRLGNKDAKGSSLVSRASLVLVWVTSLFPALNKFHFAWTVTRF